MAKKYYIFFKSMTVIQYKVNSATRHERDKLGLLLTVVLLKKEQNPCLGL